MNDDGMVLEHQCFQDPQEAQSRSLEVILEEINFPRKFLEKD